jgi:hypothetical protein
LRSLLRVRRDHQFAVIPVSTRLARRLPSFDQAEIERRLLDIAFTSSLSLIEPSQFVSSRLKSVRAWLAVPPTPVTAAVNSDRLIQPSLLVSRLESSFCALACVLGSRSRAGPG